MQAMPRNVRGMNRNPYKLCPPTHSYLPLLHAKNHLDKGIVGKNETLLFFKEDDREELSVQQHFGRDMLGV